MQASKTAISVVICGMLIAGAGIAAQHGFAREKHARPPESADGKPATVLRGAEFDTMLRPASQSKDAQGTEYVVRGTQLFDAYFLKADRIVFEPGAKLIFSRDALAARRHLWVVANEIVVDQGHPGTISWEKAVASAEPPAPGEAPGGNVGASDGTAGKPGRAGGIGIEGVAGEDAPQITLIVLRVPTSGVVVDLTGADGGKGGHGMQGGRGGNGAKGSPASQTMFGCRAGGGNGGAGGTGGVGGVGGTGGRGGAGGSFLLVSTQERLTSLSAKFRVRQAGGDGGAPGDGGHGGAFGSGGPGGADARPYCGGGSPGADGASGQPGQIGAKGRLGQEGEFTVGAATDEQLAAYVWPSSPLPWLALKLR